MWGGAVAVLALARGLAVAPDFLVFWGAGRALAQGADPYAVIAASGGGYPLYYPLPAVLVMAPFGLVPWPVAMVAFVALGGALLGLAAHRHGRGLGVALVSAPFLNAAIEGQWAPLLVAATVLPYLSPLLVAKPSIGLALWLYRPSRAAVVGGLLLVAASFALQPGWLTEWLRALGATNHVPPIFRPGGVVLLLAFLKWRTPECRLVGALACIPHTSSLFEALPLFLVTRSRWEGYLLAALSMAALVAREYMVRGVTLEARLAGGWPALFVCLWLPALLLAFRAARRPEHSP